MTIYAGFCNPISSKLSLQSDENTNEIKPVAAPPTSNPASENEHKIGLWVGIGIGVGLVLGLLGLICALLWKRSREKKGELVFDLNMADEFPKGTGPKSFCYNELVSATNKFAEKLGQGGFGGVYKGYLKDLKSYVYEKRGMPVTFFLKDLSQRGKSLIN